MNTEKLEYDYWHKPLNSNTGLTCEQQKLNTRLRIKAAGGYVQPFKEWFDNFKHQYPNGF